jgi:nicotinate-nucleotide adenylyltransferase
MTKKKQIGIYSGSFNPIHLGHTQLAKHIIDQKIVDEVWFVVSPCNPLKERSELLDEYIRLEMLVLALQDQSQMKASDVEFSLPIPSYSIDTLNVLKSQHPTSQFYLIIGSDNALIFDQWKDYNQLLENFPVLVYPRKGYDFETVADKYPSMQLLSTPYYDISSTQIRQLIQEQQDLSSYLHPSVIQLIKENQFYDVK